MISELWEGFLSLFSSYPLWVSLGVLVLIVGGWSLFSLWMDKAEGHWREKMFSRVIIFTLSLLFFLFLVTADTTMNVALSP